jgi:hypothetical protein
MKRLIVVAVLGFLSLVVLTNLQAAPTAAFGGGGGGGFSSTAGPCTLDPATWPDCIANAFGGPSTNGGFGGGGGGGIDDCWHTTDSKSGEPVVYCQGQGEQPDYSDPFYGGGGGGQQEKDPEFELPQ